MLGKPLPMRLLGHGNCPAFPSACRFFRDSRSGDFRPAQFTRRLYRNGLQSRCCVAPIRGLEDIHGRSTRTLSKHVQKGKGCERQSANFAESCNGRKTNFFAVSRWIGFITCASRKIAPAKNSLCFYKISLSWSSKRLKTSPTLRHAANAPRRHDA